MLIRTKPRPIGAKAKILSTTPLSRLPIGDVVASQSQPQRHSSSSSSSDKTHKQKVIFSGIQPTGVPHLGNYLGALKQWVHLQNTAAAESNTKLLFSVVDLHAITSVEETAAAVSKGQDGESKADVLRQRRRDMLASLLAVGLDPEKCTMFYQSAVPAHSELMWILSCTASMGYLSRMTQWKSKLNLDSKTEALDEESKTKLKLGLFSYPVLQAADIMVHGATHVPVGDDQKQHLEFTRECAMNFNSNYHTNILIPPETLLTTTRRVMSLRKPTSKMSKSEPTINGKILITDQDTTIRKKIMSALTDEHSDHVSYDPINRPGVSNLLDILSFLDGQGKSATELAEEFSSSSSSSSSSGDSMMMFPIKQLKQRTAEAVVRELSDVRSRYLDYTTGKGGKWLDDIAANGAMYANANAQVTLRRVKEAVGLL